MTTPNNAAPDPYVLGTDDVELERLGVQHRLWADAAHALWARLGVRPGASVLDIGCGPGFASRDLAEWVTSEGRVVGIDESAYFIDAFNSAASAAGQNHTRGIVGDVAALDGLLPPGLAFDAAYARWVLCFVPDASAVIRAAAARLRPGARIGVHDYFNYEHAFTCAPRDERFDRVVDAITRSWRDRGGDPDVVGRLPEYAEAAGLRVEHVGVHQRVATAGSPMWSWPNTFWASVLPRLVQSGHLSPEDRAGFEGLWAEMQEDRRRFLVPPPVFEFVAFKP